MAPPLGNYSAQTKPFYHSLLREKVILEAPINSTPCWKTERSPLCRSTSSLFLPSRLCRMSISSRYLEQNVKHSPATYASAMDPLGLAMFLTKCFKVCNLLSMGYIHPYCTGPLRSASSGKWTAKCIMTSNKGGNIFSNVQRMIRISAFILCKTSTLRVFEHKF